MQLHLKFLLLFLFLIPNLAFPNVITINLTPQTLPDSRRNQVLNNLKLRQVQGKTALLQIDNNDVTLNQQILAEKHIATYSGSVKINHRNAVSCLFDTGSSEFWAISDECTTERCVKHDRIPRASISTSTNSTTLPRLHIKYLSGRVEGSVYSLPVTIGSVTVPGQSVGIANIVDIELLDDVSWSCILGLGYPPQDHVMFSVFDSIMQQHLLSSQRLSNQFGYYLDNDKGAVTLGGVNCAFLHYSSTRNCIRSFSFTPVIEKLYWTIKLTKVSVRYPSTSEEKVVCQESAAGCKAIVDTGTYIVYAPEQQYQQLFGNSGNINSCADYSTLPTVYFSFYTGPGREPFVLSLEPERYILKFNVAGKDDCVSGISPDSDTIWTLGQVFLRSYYTIFDRDEDRIGFSKVNTNNRGSDGELHPLFGHNARFKKN